MKTDNKKTIEVTFNNKMERIPRRPIPIPNVTNKHSFKFIFFSGAKG